MIVRNEADRIANVLEDASICCDELVVVDTGSTDATMEIAEEYDAEVWPIHWHDDFAKARNFAFGQCTSDWILWLDADDHLPVESAMAIRDEMWRSIVIAAGDIDAIVAPYRMVNAAGDVTLTFDRERLIRRKAGLRWQGRVHENIAVRADRTVRLDNFWVEHRPGLKVSNPFRNLRILEDMYASGDDSPRTLFYLANEYRDVGDPEMARLIYNKRLERTDGWAEETAQAAYELGKLLMGLDNAVAEEWLLEAVELSHGERAEPMRQLEHLYFTSGKRVQAAVWQEYRSELRQPSSGLFIEPWAYLP